MWSPKANIVRFLTIFLKSFPYVWKCKSVCVGGWREHLRVRGKTFCYNDSSKDLLHSLKSPSSCFDLSVKVKTDNFVDDWRTLVSFLLFFSVEFLKIVCTCDLFYHLWININVKLLNCLDTCMSIDNVFHYNAFAHLRVSNEIVLMLRGANLRQICSFFEHCSKSLCPPPPLRFEHHVANFFWWIS